MNMKTPLSRARGLGSAKRGVANFWTERVSAAALVPLGVWFLATIVAYAGADYEAVIVYLRKPVVITLFVLFIGAAFIHTRLGLHVVTEDYIRRESTKLMLRLVIDFSIISLGVLAIISLLRIAFSG